MEQRVRGAFKSFLVMSILERAGELARAGADVIHLEVGEPDFEAPACARDAACRAIRDGRMGYTHSLGLVELREEIARHYLEEYGTAVHPDRILVTPGTSPAMLMACLALLDPGDRVALTDPHYACYPNFVRTAGGEPVFIPVREEEGFQFSAEQVAALSRKDVRAVMVNSPGNPTGTLLDPVLLERLCGAGPTVLSDEIYHGLNETGEDRSALEFTDDCLVFNGFSKRYAMTGWRLGYMIAPQDLMPLLQKMQQSFVISTNEAAQWAGVAVLREGAQDAARMARIFDHRRRVLVEGLKALGFSLAVEPRGAFYVFVNATHLGRNSLELAFDILERAHVGVTPGVDFGAGGEGFLRFSCANSLERIEEALERLRRYIEMRN